jgi:uncharacterized caspase-like protein
MLRIAVALLVCMISAGPALAQKRVALVVGNASYKFASKLENPRNDAASMAAALRKVGFQVIDGFDLDKAEFDRRVRDFSVALRGAEVGLFFYSGHGLQVGGQNYLVPVDAKAEAADALDWEMMRLDLVQRTMERAASTNILFLDACRNNPLARNLARAMGTRSVEIGRGLAPVEGGVGTLISFSTQPGNIALDGQGHTSPFAGALSKRIANSAEDLSALLIDVRNDVRKETQNAQVPWEHSALTGRFYFTPPKASAPLPPPVVQLSEAAQVWATIKDTRDTLTLEAFRRQYGAANPLFDRLAEARIEELKTQRSGGGPPPPAAAGTIVAGYQIERFSSIVGDIIAGKNVRVDASKPDEAIAMCSKICDTVAGCAAFDISVVHNNCVLYRSVDRKGALGGYISGVKIAK